MWLMGARHDNKYIIHPTPFIQPSTVCRYEGGTAASTTVTYSYSSPSHPCISSYASRMHAIRVETS
jgi:hypothetical protein